MSDSDFDEEDLPDDFAQIMQMMDEIERQMDQASNGGFFQMLNPMMMTQQPTISTTSQEVINYELTKEEKDARFEEIKAKQRANADNSSDSSLSTTQVQLYAFIAFMAGAVIYMIVQSLRLNDEDSDLQQTSTGKAK